MIKAIERNYYDQGENTARILIEFVRKVKKKEREREEKPRKKTKESGFKTEKKKKKQRWMG